MAETPPGCEEQAKLSWTQARPTTSRCSYPGDDFPETIDLKQDMLGQWSVELTNGFKKANHSRRCSRPLTTHSRQPSAGSRQPSEGCRHPLAERPLAQRAAERCPDSRDSSAGAEPQLAGHEPGAGPRHPGTPQVGGSGTTKQPIQACGPRCTRCNATPARTLESGLAGRGDQRAAPRGTQGSCDRRCARTDAPPGMHERQA